MHLLDHVSISVPDLERARPFYDAIMSALNCEKVYDRPDALGYGARCRAGSPDETYLAVYLSPDANVDERRHGCFKAKSRAAVRAFHAAALAHAGSSAGPPGLREHYHASYYAAFVLDPHGNRVEAVCHVGDRETDVVSDIQDFRDFYARFIVASAGSSNERLIAAFAAVEREHFVGDGPWSVRTEHGYVDTVSRDPRLLYQDVLIGLATERGINNGQPRLHAECLAAVDPIEGESVVHVGTGTGYYTAVLAQLIGATGTIHAYEIEADLADRARSNLASLRNVRVHCASGADRVLPTADVIYVSAGATHPLGNWLDALAPGGRLICPLTPDEGVGCMLRVTRAQAGYAARIVMRAAFIPCIGARDDAASRSLSDALGARDIDTVRSLRRDSRPDDTAWCAGADWWLSTAAVS